MRSPSLLLVVPFLLTAPGGTLQAAEPVPIRVAVFDDAGVSRGVDALVELLGKHPDLRLRRVKAADIRAGVLDEFDILLHPGGSGGNQGKALGGEGRERVRAFVQRGGGYVGICAGAYLATRDYPWSLNLLDARVVDKAHWARGTGDVEITLTDQGRKLLGIEGERTTIYYHQGPLLAPAGDEAIPDYDVLARFAGEIAKNGAPKGVMAGTTAVATGTFGKGRVLCFSPHPERTEGLKHLVHRAISWSARRS